MVDERALLLVSLGAYFIAALVGLFALRKPRAAPAATIILGLALSAHALSIGLRWARLGHGPYVNLYEILSSNVWSLHAAVFAAAIASGLARRLIGLALAVLQILTLWLFITPPVDSPLPITYSSPWLPVHITLGKIFLGLTLLAVGLSIAVITRRVKPASFSNLPPSPILEETAFRLMLVAAIFESLMLIAGAAWAQDAWGHYWAWDPLEIWAFATWASVIAYLHWRSALKPNPERASLAVIGIFVMAFLTFFGVPFLSTAPHKGAI
ncbi:MAG TPA: cytochrome c biogenesis protein CcsA [Parvularculaceae bacterium]|nr:cytochrome c biogenesis protein CcsA [Parvularculaceae bacterium]